MAEVEAAMNEVVVACAYLERHQYQFALAGNISVRHTVRKLNAEFREVSRLRADVLGRVVVRSCHATASFGAAVLGATAAVYGGGVCAAIRRMTCKGAGQVPTPVAYFARRRFHADAVLVVESLC